MVSQSVLVSASWRDSGDGDNKGLTWARGHDDNTTGKGGGGEVAGLLLVIRCIRRRQGREAQVSIGLWGRTSGGDR
jgi:hypothetical protein